MGVIVSGFLALCDSRHMTSDAVGKRMDRMSHVLVNHLMTHQTQMRAGSFGLKLGRRHPQLMHIVTGCACHTLVGMGGKFPTLILLVVALPEIFSIDIFNMPIPESV